MPRREAIWCGPGLRWLIRPDTNGAGQPCIRVEGPRGECEYPVRYPDGRVAWDWPNRVPEYVKRAAARFLRPWVNEYGHLIRRLPQSCLDECSTPGQPADEPVREWCTTLHFTVPRAVALRYLHETGAHTREEWEAMTDEHLAEWCLWLLCSDSREERNEHKAKRFPQPLGLCH